MKTNRLLLTLSFATLALAGTSLYAQQEVDPTWYDPCPEPANVTTPAPVARRVNQPANQAKAISSLPARQTVEPQAKRFVNPQAGSPIASSHRVAISPELELHARNVSSPFMMPSHELMLYTTGPANGRGSPAPGMVEDKATLTATETIYELKPTL